MDVEEEGLFSGRHPRQAGGLRNLAFLRRLEFISRRFGLPLTLLATYPVLNDQASREILLAWREDHGAELGAHLHPWNTPPFALREPWQAWRLPPQALRAKFAHLLHCHHELLGQPARSFRMGRFELLSWLRAEMPACGLRVDSSQVPLHYWGPGGLPFLSPADPYPLAAEAGRPVLWEAPLTVLPLWPGSDQAAERLAGGLPQRPARQLLNGFRYLGAVGVQPTMYSAPVMRLAARLHLARGDRVLTLYLHSSELMPGGSPAYASEQSVQGLLGKMHGFLEWLGRRWHLRGLTLSQIPRALAGDRLSKRPGTAPSETPA